MTTTDPWLVIGVAAITAIAVIVAAIIAAITAGRRQKRELRHDRDLASLDDRRAVLDETARLLMRLNREVPQSVAAANNDPDISWSFESHTDVEHAEARLIIRLGMDHPAPEAFREVIRRLKRRRDGDSRV